MVTKYEFKLINSDEDEIELDLIGDVMAVTTVDKNLTQFFGTPQELANFGNEVKRIQQMLGANGLIRLEVEEKEV